MTKYSAPSAKSRSQLRTLLGVGAEIGLTQAWSAKLEYLYISYSGSNYSITGTNNGLDTNLVRLGVNYRF